MYSNGVSGNDWDCLNGNPNIRNSLNEILSAQCVGAVSNLWIQQDSATNEVIAVPAHKQFETYQREIQVLESMNLLGNKEPELRMSRITRCFKLNKL